MAGGVWLRAGISLALAGALLGSVTLAQAEGARYVNGMLGLDTSACSQGQPCKTVAYAIQVAQAGDTIYISPGRYYEDPLTINKALTLQGVEGERPVLYGNGLHRVLAVNAPGAVVTLSDLTVQSGATSGAGAGVWVQAGTLDLRNVTLQDNQAALDDTAYGGGLACEGSETVVNVRRTSIQYNHALQGGGVWVGRGCRLEMLESTLSGNQGPQGAALWVEGLASLRNVTITMNIHTTPSTLPGPAVGSIIVLNDATLSCDHCTLANNRQPDDLPSLMNLGTFAVRNSLLFEQDGSTCAVAAGLTSLGYNLAGDGSCGLAGVGDEQVDDPRLGGLADYGGATRTLALEAGSPAVDGGSPPEEGGLTGDQRGMAYRDGDFDGLARGDIGAYEYQPLSTWLALVTR